METAHKVRVFVEVDIFTYFDEFVRRRQVIQERGRYYAQYFMHSYHILILLVSFFIFAGLKHKKGRRGKRTHKKQRLKKKDLRSIFEQNAVDIQTTLYPVAESTSHGDNAGDDAGSFSSDTMLWTLPFYLLFLLSTTVLCCNVLLPLLLNALHPLMHEYCASDSGSRRGHS